MSPPLTSAERVARALSHQEGDRVPFVLPTLLQGARLLGLSIRDYFADAEAVAEGQVLLQRRYRTDGVFGFYHSSQEHEAFGGDTLFRDDGPPNAGAPVLRAPSDIDTLQVPSLQDCPTLQRVLRTIRTLKARLGDAVPIFGGVISPFSLPIMQLGFEPYLRLLHDDPARLHRLLAINREFTVAWARAQIEAGAGAISYADPMGSPTMVPRELYLRTGHPIALSVVERVGAPFAINFASARVLPILDDVVDLGALAICASTFEDLAEVKRAAAGRLVVMGNLNAIEMCRWTPADAEAHVQDCLARAGRGGGFVLSDNHGEIPWQVQDDVLMAVSEAVHRWGRQPLSWGP